MTVSARAQNAKLTGIATCKKKRIDLHGKPTCCMGSPDANECARLNPSQASWYLIYIPWKDKRLS